MSYPRDLDEYTEDEIRAEIERRELARMDGRCDYCGRHQSNPPCRFPKRHNTPTPGASDV